MAPRRPEKTTKQPSGSQNDGPDVVTLVRAAEAHLEEGNAAEALVLATAAVDRTKGSSSSSSSSSSDEEKLAALDALGNVQLALGEFEEARAHFLRAAELDPEGTREDAVGGAGHSKFMYLAQLSPEGGADTVMWSEKGVAAIKARIAVLEEVEANLQRQKGGSSSSSSRTTAAATRNNNDSSSTTTTTTQKATDDGPEIIEVDEVSLMLVRLRRGLAQGLCSIAEVYMTDLSWEADAEARCESLVTEATMADPDCAEAWQTLASVRISQQRPDDARAALDRSMELWRELDPEDPGVPEFGSRVALARMLIEVAREPDAVEVLERLVMEDDHSVEAWYLGGWGFYVRAERAREEGASGSGEDAKMATDDKADKKSDEDGKAVWAADGRKYDIPWQGYLATSRVWLNECMRQYRLEGYEDERLGAHAQELLESITSEIGEAPPEDDNQPDVEDWEEIESESDDDGDAMEE